MSDRHVLRIVVFTEEQSGVRAGAQHGLPGAHAGYERIVIAAQEAR